MHATAHPDESLSWLVSIAVKKAPNEDEAYYFKFTLISIAYFCAMHLIIHLVCLRYNPRYQREEPRQKALYRSYVVSPIHAFTAVILATIGMFFVCGDDKNVFNDDVCLNTPRYIHIWALLHTTGYFIHDFYIQYFVVGGTSALDYQTYAHHIIGAVTFYQTLYFMDFMVVFGVMLLFTEISTTYVSMRWLMYKHEMTNSALYVLNCVLLFAFFLFGRLIY